MKFQEFATQFGQRTTGALNGLKNNLTSAGVPGNGITVEEVTTEGVNDLRYRITARRGNRTLICFVELTASGFINGAMAVVLTLYVEGNGGQITTSYTPGAPVAYNDEAALDALLSGKLTQIENASTGELLTAARAFLQV